MLKYTYGAVTWYGSSSESVMSIVSSGLLSLSNSSINPFEQWGQVKF